ncbi:TPT-domain-containing protein [Serendipita vermifera]|nr:TPT-domain-containing protein [Serendipita vermifera]
MDSGPVHSWPHRTTLTPRIAFPVVDSDAERRENINTDTEGDGSTPPSYHLHDLRSLGNITFADPRHLQQTSILVHKEVDPSAYTPTSTRVAEEGQFDSISHLPSHSLSEEAIQNAAHPSPLWRCHPMRLSAEAHRLVHSEPFWLVLYFMFNLGLTLYNKFVLVTFPFPYTLTAIHTLCGSVGCYVLRENEFYTPARLTTRQNLVLFAFSVLYTVNIAVSNLSLQLVTIPFHQVVRAASPLFTIVLAYYISSTRVSSIKLLSLLPVVAGVGFTTYGDYYFTWWGLVLTVFGTFLAALKTIVTNILQSGNPRLRLAPESKGPVTKPIDSGLKLHPLDLLGRMSPLAFIQCVLYATMSGELDRVRKYGALAMDNRKMLALSTNGLIAFGLNIVSFTANKKSGPLTMNIAANVKQVLTMASAVVIFDLVITPANLLGIVLTLLGGAWYALVEYREKAKKKSLIALTSL